MTVRIPLPNAVCTSDHMVTDSSCPIRKDFVRVEDFSTSIHTLFPVSSSIVPSGHGGAEQRGRHGCEVEMRGVLQENAGGGKPGKNVKRRANLVVSAGFVCLA